MGTLAEWLRRGPAKAVCNACESSNLSGVGNNFGFLCYHRTIYMVLKEDNITTRLSSVGRALDCSCFKSVI